MATQPWLLIAIAIINLLAVMAVAFLSNLSASNRFEKDQFFVTFKDTYLKAINEDWLDALSLLKTMLSTKTVSQELLISLLHTKTDLNAASTFLRNYFDAEFELSKSGRLDLTGAIVECDLHDELETLQFALSELKSRDALTFDEANQISVLVKEVDLKLKTFLMDCAMFSATRNSTGIQRKRWLRTFYSRS